MRIQHDTLQQGKLIHAWVLFVYYSMPRHGVTTKENVNPPALLYIYQLLFILAEPRQLRSQIYYPWHVVCHGQQRLIKRQALRH